MLEGHESIEDGYALDISAVRQIRQGLSANVRCFSEDLDASVEIPEAIPDSSLHRDEGRYVVVGQLLVFWV